MRRKYQSRSIYLTDDPIEIYKGVQSGMYNKYPADFMDENNMKIIMRYIFLEERNYGKEDICKLVRADLKILHLTIFFKIKSCFYDIINISFPEMQIKEWEMCCVSNTFWHIPENRKRYFTWLCEKYKLDITKKEDLCRINIFFLKSNYGSKVISAAGGVYPFIKECTNTPYLEWEICKVAKWDEQKAHIAVKWLIEEKLKLSCDKINEYSDSQLLKIVTRNEVIKYDLQGLLKSIFKMQILDMIRFEYPKKK